MCTPGRRPSRPSHPSVACSLTHTTYSHTTLPHTTLSHTTPSHTTPSFTLCVAGVALMALGWLGSVVAVDAAAVCVAGVAFGSIDLHSVWQAWHLVTSTTGLALGDINTAARLVPVGAAAVCVVGVASTSILCGVAFGDINLHSVAAMALISLGWLWWRAWFPLAPRLSVWQAWRLEASTSILCGRRGTWRHRTSLCVATDGKCGNSEPEAVALPFTLCGKLNQREANLMLWHSLTLSSVQRFR